MTYRPSRPTSKTDGLNRGKHWVRGGPRGTKEPLMSHISNKTFIEGIDRIYESNTPHVTSINVLWGACGIKGTI